MNIQFTFSHCLRIGSLSIAGVLCNTIPVFATGNVDQAVITSDVSVPIQSQYGIIDSSLSPSIIRRTVNQDEAYAATTLNGFAGYGTLNVHACSGPPKGATKLGRGEGVGNFQYNDSFQIISSTLAEGTLVDITLIADASLSDNLSLITNNPDQSFGPNDAAQISGGAVISFTGGDPSTQYRFDGDFFRTNMYLDGEQKRKTGIFNVAETPNALSLTGGNSIQHVIQGRVGEKIDLFANAHILADSYASFGVISNVDAQMSLSGTLTKIKPKQSPN